jgi:hypothetical protein
MVPGNLLHACERGPSESIPEKGSAITAGAGDFGALGFSGAPRRSIFREPRRPGAKPGVASVASRARRAISAYRGPAYASIGRRSSLLR